MSFATTAFVYQDPLTRPDFDDPAYVQDYATLRNLADNRMVAYVTGFYGVTLPSGNAGYFVRDDNDTTSVDNGGTILVAGNGKRWKRLFPGSDIQLEWFIPDAQLSGIRTGATVYDCSTALTSAIAAQSFVGLGVALLTGGPKIHAGVGKFHYESSQHWKKRVHLVGVGAAQAGGWTTQFDIKAGTHGIVIHKENTDATGTVAATTGADGSIIEGIVFYGNDGAVSAHGVWMRARATVRDCMFSHFKGNGINIVASAGAGGFIEGNANNFQVSNCRFEGMGGWGMFIDGADANAGTTMGCDFSLNTAGGLFDSSFLGNTHIGLHGGDNLGPVYKTDSANARNLFIGCYSEGGQPAAQFVLPTMVLGGIHGAGITGTYIDMQSFPTKILGTLLGTAGQSCEAAFGNVEPGTNGGAAVYLTASDEPGAFPIRLKYKKGVWFLDWANTLFEFFKIFNTAATIANGFARDIVGTAAIGMEYFYLGSDTEMRKRGVIAGSSGVGVPAIAHLVGDAYDYTVPVAGGFKGVVCVTAGNPGTFQPYGLINGGGGAVVQGVSKATAVVLNTRRGQITMNNAALAAGATVFFGLSNNVIGADDTLIIHRKSGGTAGAYTVWVDAVAAGSASIGVKNNTAGALGEAVVLQYEVRPGAIA